MLINEWTRQWGVICVFCDVQCLFSSQLSHAFISNNIAMQYIIIIPPYEPVSYQIIILSNIIHNNYNNNNNNNTHKVKVYYHLLVVPDPSSNIALEDSLLLLVRLSDALATRVMYVSKRST